MKESEAYIKRCCGPDGCGYPNGYDSVQTGEFVMQVPKRFCIASDCMAWQLDEPVRTAVDETNPFKGNEMRSLGGYCGLAK